MGTVDKKKTGISYTHSTTTASEKETKNKKKQRLLSPMQQSKYTYSMVRSKIVVGDEMNGTATESQYSTVSKQCNTASRYTNTDTKVKGEEEIVET